MLSQLLSQNFTFCSQPWRHESHCRLHSSQPTLVKQLVQPGHPKRQDESALLQLSRHRLFSPPQSRFGGDGADDRRGGDDVPAGFAASFDVPVPVSEIGASAVGGMTTLLDFFTPTTSPFVASRAPIGASTTLSVARARGSTSTVPAYG